MDPATTGPVLTATVLRTMVLTMDMDTAADTIMAPTGLTGATATTGAPITVTHITATGTINAERLPRSGSKSEVKAEKALVRGARSLQPDEGAIATNNKNQWTAGAKLPHTQKESSERPGSLRSLWFV
jgi:hypothetical protein